jgi:hypothetical protein
MLVALILLLTLIMTIGVLIVYQTFVDLLEGQKNE